MLHEHWRRSIMESSLMALPAICKIEEEINYHSKARDVLEQILKDYPKDLTAYKLFYDNSFCNGDKSRPQSFAERTWKSNLPLYNYLYGYKAFSLCESGDYESSKVFAKKGLELIPTDIWSTHYLAHDYEMTRECVEG